MRVLDVPRDRATLIVLVLLGGAAYALLPFAIGIVPALVLCVLTAPIYDGLTRHVPGAMSTTLIILLMLGLVILPLIWLVIALGSQAQEVFHNAQASAELANYARLKVGGVDLGTRASAASGAALKWASVMALNLASGLAGGVLQFAIACLCLAFLLPTRHALSQLHPLLTLLGVLSGLHLFGLLGLILGPLILSYAIRVYQIYGQEYGSTNTATAG